MPNTRDDQKLQDDSSAKSNKQSRKVKQPRKVPVAPPWFFLANGLTFASQQCILALNAVIGRVPNSYARYNIRAARLAHVVSLSLPLIFFSAAASQLFRLARSKRMHMTSDEFGLVGLGSFAYLVSVGAVCKQLYSNPKALSISLKQSLATYGSLLLGAGGLMLVALKKAREVHDPVGRQQWIGFTTMQAALVAFAVAKLRQKGAEQGVVSTIVSCLAAVIFERGHGQFIKGSALECEEAGAVQARRP